MRSSTIINTSQTRYIPKPFVHRNRWGVYIPAAKSAFFDGFCAESPDGTPGSHINLFGQFFEFLRVADPFLLSLDGIAP